MLKKVLLGVLAVVLVVAIGGGGFFFTRVWAFDDSFKKVYDVPVPDVTASTDPAVIERGKHLAESLGACLACHGEGGANGRTEKMGPLGTLQPPNITKGKNGRGAVYTDGELARLIKHAIRK